MKMLYIHLLLILLAMASCSAPMFLHGRDAGPGNIQPANLLCEYRVDPIGIDTVKPRLSWICLPVDRTERGLEQSSFRILVASSAELLEQDRGDIWDSGRVASNSSVHVEYDGETLRSRQRCFWKVMLWDMDGGSSAWSEPATWETALMRAEDWSAQWITPGPWKELPHEPIPLKEWIWHSSAKEDGARVFFRRELVLDDSVSGIDIILSADNSYALFVNGTKLEEDGGWELLETISLEMNDHIATGKNIIAVEAANTDGPCGFVCGIRLHHREGESMTVLPSKGWLCSTKDEKGWMEAGFVCDAENWIEPEKVTDYGGEPWGDLNRIKDEPRRSQLVRRGFDLPAPVSKARAYVTGLGLYELHMNGKRVGEDVLTPGWTLYPKRIQYQVYDVTGLLGQGQNSAGAILGNGWWSGGLGWHGGSFRFAAPEENLRFLMQLEIECVDGSRHVIATGPGWKFHESPITEDTLYHGESYDARLEKPGWAAAGFEDSDWSPAVIRSAPAVMETLCVQQGHALRVTEELETVSITRADDGSYVFDFGQNHSGRCCLTVEAPAGTEIRIRHAETLNPDGTIYTENYRSARVTDTYICRGDGIEAWEPAFTYCGFRYAALSGYPGEPTKKSLVSRVLHSAPPMAGRFECSNRLLNRIHKNVLWGQRSNMHSVPTDCPQRDERLGWMGDAQVFAPTSCWNMDMALFYTKWMRDVMDSQHDDGSTTDVCPVIVLDRPAAPGWGDAVMVVPWTAYLFYGDKRILEECYDAMKSWVEYMRGVSKENLYEKEGYGDWVAVESSPSAPIGTAYYFYSTKLLARIAGILGKNDDKSEYQELAGQIADAFNSKHLSPDDHFYGSNIQTENLLPLTFGITPSAFEQKVADHIASDVIERAFHLSTGFLGTPHLLPVLTKYGHHDTAYRVASSESYPSLGYMVENGATTVWERWNSDVAGPGMNSRNHFAFGCMTAWYFEALAGIMIDEEKPGFESVNIVPRPSGDLTWARASYPSIRGTITSAWIIEDGSIHLKVQIPANTKARVHIPCGDPRKVTESGKPVEESDGVTLLRAGDREAVYAIGSGEYDFVAPFKEK